MNELNLESTSRLRRRSFFESIETDSATSSNVTLNEVDLTTAASTGGSLSDSESTGGDSGQLKPVKVGTSHFTGATDDHDPAGRRFYFPPWSCTQVVLKWLQAVWRYITASVDVAGTAWTARFPAAASKVRAWHHTTAHFCVHGPYDYIKRRRGDGAATPVKYWVYPTQYLTYASGSLFLLELLLYCYFYTFPLDLQVSDCVFRERLLASVTTTRQLPQTAGSTPVQSVAAAATTSTSATLKFLERRFEQQYSPGSRQTGQTRVPWTCLAIVATESDTATARQTTELAFLWPRSQVVTASALHRTVASRVHVAVGANPLDTSAEPPAVARAGVFAALFPLSAMRSALFAPRFPDLVLVTTEFALRQMLKFRQERQEERDHRRRAGAPPLRAVGYTNSPTDVAAASHFGVYLLRATVPDIYDRRIRKQWDEFLHVVVVDGLDKKEQFTEELLSAWVAHPTWPVLHVRFQNSLGLCRSFQRLVSSMRKDYEAGTEAAWTRVQNVDLVCEENANAPQEIARLKNAIGIHLFPVPPELEKYEVTVLESLAVGAVTVTYNTPIMQEWVPDSAGLRVGVFDYDSTTGGTDENMQVKTDAADQDMSDDDKGVAKDEQELAYGSALVKLPSVHVTRSEIEHAVEKLLSLDRVSRVAAGRSARVHYMRMRTHYFSAVAALDAAICEGDSEDIAETQSEIGQHRRRKVEVETLRAFLY
uniref:Glycosyltransferase n=1 Tax=Peronospora matthiolae TaxID=2874970 RepID=A0AAV1UUQ3_9STRA